MTPVFGAALLQLAIAKECSHTESSFRVKPVCHTKTSEMLYSGGDQLLDRRDQSERDEKFAHKRSAVSRNGSYRHHQLLQVTSIASTLPLRGRQHRVGAV
jgi:hypothetical protein